MASQAQRHHLQQLMGYLLERESQVHYAEVRPMRTVHLLEGQLRQLLDGGGQITMDCSEAVTCLCKWAGLHDPNGLGYDGKGYTGTILSAGMARGGVYTNPRNAEAGALVVFGPGTGDHVSMVYRPDAEHGDPLLWSHGTERGPLTVRLEVEQQYHRPPTRLVSIARL